MQPLGVDFLFAFAGYNADGLDDTLADGDIAGCDADRRVMPSLQVFPRHGKARHEQRCDRIHPLILAE
jgi:hypothetical protein